MHGKRIELKQFYRFLKENIDSVEQFECHEEAIEAAKLIRNDIDMRSFDYEGSLGTLRFNMHAKYLPLPHQTQFVESAVKEAKLVSATDRSEQQRSCYAIIRSATSR